MDEEGEEGSKRRGIGSAERVGGCARGSLKRVASARTKPTCVVVSLSPSFLSHQLRLIQMSSPLLIASGAARNNAQDCRILDGLVAFAAGRAVALWSSSVRPSFFDELSSPSNTQADLKQRRTRTIRVYTRLCRGTRATSAPSSSLTMVQGAGGRKAASSSREMRRERQECGRRLMARCVSSLLLYASLADLQSLQWWIFAVLSGHSGSVSSVDAIELESEGGEKELLVLTGGSDSFVQVWRVSSAGNGSFSPFSLFSSEADPFFLQPNSSRRLI
jgi:WD40 repeat protein